MAAAKDSVGRLRKIMRERGAAAYLVPSSDPHQNEYVPEFWQRRKFISGFTGSAGEACITLEKAGLWTDSRYFIQAEDQLDPEVFTLFKAGLPDTPAIREWLVEELHEGDTLAVDPRTITHKSYSELKTHLEKHNISVRCETENLVDLIWEEKPEPPGDPIILHGEDLTGESVIDKLIRLRKVLAEEPASAHIITKLDSIAWLFNIRGSDIAYNPVAIAYALVTADEAVLFIEEDKVPDSVRFSLEQDIRIEPYSAFAERVREMPGKGSVWLDESSVSQWIVDLIGESAPVLKRSPIELFKAVKNHVEAGGMRNAHVRDGAAMVRFLHWLENALGHEPVTEMSAAAKAEEFRSGMERFMGMSFETISSFGIHGAVVHYAVTPETDIPIEGRGLYLIDSGGQYLDGTTDITRTIVVGTPTEEEKDCFTRVLKGLIDLTSTSFPKGTVGKQLDVLARRPLWELGLNFLHGTGHGLGHYLNVHEGPQAISYYRCVGVALEPGMITTIEPGYYKEGEFGLRVENAVLVVRDENLSGNGQEFYGLDTLTLCPIDKKLIKTELLSDREREWLNSYHDRVREKLTSMLSPEEAAWLETATRPL